LIRPKTPASVGGGFQRAVKSSMDSANIQRGLNPPLNEVSFKGPLSLNLTLTNIDGAINVEGTIKAVLDLACGRCLELCRYNLACSLSETFYFSAEGAKPPDEEWIFFSGETLDLTREVYKAIVLALPMRGLCREDCRGLCPVCGVNINREQCDCKADSIDPRLTKLQELFKK
ncbi:MAG: DUF177 domain-containing protein, partial [Bacillota bacterium]